MAFQFSFRTQYSFSHHDGYPCFLGILAHPHDGTSIDVLLHVDTGAQRSFLDGSLLAAIGLEPKEQELTFQTVSGESLGAQVHECLLGDEIIGLFSLPVCFSVNRLRRNLVGRDFLERVEMCLIQNLSELYLGLVPVE